MKQLLGILCVVVCFNSCDQFDSEVTDFEPGSFKKILDGYDVRSIVFDSKGCAWIITQEELIRCSENGEIDHSKLPKDLWICDVAIDKKDNIWIGTDDGVWKYDGKRFILYNSQNTSMPEDIVWSIAVDSKNNIWMASCRMRQGGLVKYNGSKWTTYTPGNSDLPVNMIHAITIDQSDKVWLALGEYVTQSYLVKISNNNWTVYDENDFGFKPYWFAGIKCDGNNRVLAAITYMFSSFSVPHFPYFFIFDGKNTTQLSWGDNITLSEIAANREEKVFCFGGVWIGDQWRPINTNSSEFDGLRVKVVKEDAKRRIWFGTENGIYIKCP